MEDHHLKMASLLKSPKQHTLRALEMVLVCLLVPSCFARHAPRHHIVDSYLRFWCFFLHWAFLEFYPLWHVIESTLTAALPREAPLQVPFKESLALLREMQASLAFPRETPLTFPREQPHLVLLHHLQMLIQNN
jgi:hypothetical protein